MDWYRSGAGRDRAAQQEVCLNAIQLNHPETDPSGAAGSVEKLSSMKPVPGTKRLGPAVLRDAFVHSILFPGFHSETRALPSI